MRDRRQRVGMLVGAGALVMFVVSVALTSPANGYESSVYDAYHPVTWFAFAIALTSFLLTLLTTGYRGRAIAGVGCLYLVLLTLPAQRGYVLFGSLSADILHHLGVVRDIVDTGIIPDGFYPATHILFGTVALVSGIRLEALQVIGAIVVTGLLIAGVVVSGRRHLGWQMEPYLAVAAIPLVYTIRYVGFQPWFFALVLVPLALTFFPSHENARPRRVIVTLIVAVAIVFFHPLTSLFLVGTMILTWFWKCLEARQSTGQTTVQTGVIGVGVIVISLWLLTARRFEVMLGRYLTGSIASGGVASYSDRIGQTTYTMSQLVWEFLILQWGTAIIYMTLGGIVGGIVVIRTLRHRRIDTQMLVVGWAGLGVCIGLTLAIVDIFARNPVRISQFALLFAIYLVGFALWKTVGRVHAVRPETNRFRPRERQSSRETVLTVAGVVLVSLILVTAFLGAFTMYPDDRHVTESTVEGNEWHLDYHDRTQPTFAHRMRVVVDVYHQGYLDADAREPVFVDPGPERQIPTHLGYHENEYVGQWADDAYLVTKQDDLAWATNRPENRRDEIVHYTPASLDRLSGDPSTNRIYANGDYHVWSTYGTDNETGEDSGEETD